MPAAHRLFLLLGLALLAWPLHGVPLTVVTYNVGLLRVLGSDYVPAVEARTRAAPSVLSALAERENPQVLLLEEVWEDAAAEAISRALAPQGYAAVRPRDRTLVGLTSGLLLLVKQPLRVVQWAFAPFSRSTFVDSLARKGVLTAVIEDAASGLRFRLVGTHTVAVDTNGGQPKDRGQLDAALAQVDEVRAALSAPAPTGIPVLLLGDFNVGPGYVDAVWRRLAGTEGLRDSADMVPGAGPLVTWDPQNPLVRYGSYPDEPPAAIDHILLRDGGSARWTARAVRVLMRSPPAGLAFAPRGAAASEAPVSIPLSDHYALAADLDLTPD